MDQELKQLLEWMNENLNAVVTNQAMIYAVLKKLLEKEKLKG